MIDLHTHTTASDGTLTPRELVGAARSAALTVIAITDHDTVAGVQEARASAAEVRVVAGIELSTRDGRSGANAHVLGLFIDTDSPALVSHLVGLRAEREQRGRRMVDRLRELGYRITFDDVLAEAGGAVIVRPHIARVLVSKGYVPTVSAAFTPELIADGGLADVSRRLPDPAAAVGIVVGAGGVAVLAHPGVEKSGRVVSRAVPLSLVERLSEAGLCGLEVDHPDHSAAARQRLAEVAERYGLVRTGGSDYHGPGTGSVLAQCTTSVRALDELESRAGGRTA